MSSQFVVLFIAILLVTIAYTPSLINLPLICYAIVIIQSIQHAHLLSIAFKPAESGWGGSNKYSQNFDSIFNNKNKNFSNDGTENKKSNEEEKTIRESTKTE